MEQVRKPFQGIWNIVRFNWHFYMLSLGLIILILVVGSFLNAPFVFISYISCVLILIPVIISLLVSYYVYDVSDLYKLQWLKRTDIAINNAIVNINAGFDETSVLLENKFPDSELVVFDFYDPLKHTEVSIKRARRAYPPFPNTKQITTANLPLQNEYADLIFLTLAAHEIRNESERIGFFNELKRILKDNGQIIVTEHLRDLPNFLAYTVGFFHFHSKSTWKTTFRESDFSIIKEIKITPFISTFIIKKHGITS